MDILQLNKAMVCPTSNVKIVGHVIDTGVNPVGPLAGRVEVVKYADIPGDTSRTLGGGKAYDYADSYGDVGHGTGVAYLMCHDIPAETMRIRSYNSFIAANPVNLCLAAVLEYVKEHPDERHIVNMSLTVPGEETDSYIRDMHELIKALVALNVAVVVAAGNDSREVLDKYPTCFYEPFTVAALNNDGTKAHFSTWHNEVDFAEIGVGIPRLTNAGAMQNGSGTSFATPIVCNKLAKIWSAAPALTEAQLYEQAKANCQDLGAAGRDPYFGWGWIASVDAQAAVAPPVENPGETKDDPPVTAQNRLIYLTTPRMSGADVYALELQLQALGYDCKMTAAERSSGAGIFGPACDSAVRQFQHDYNVDVYGKACPDTLAALAAAQSKDSTLTLADQFVSWLKTQVGNIYVWGAQGENLTAMTNEAGKSLAAKTPEAWIRGMEDEDSDYARALAFYKKRLAAGQNPIFAYDCGGLIVHWLHITGLLDMAEDLSSRSLYRACTPITRAELKPGNLLFRDNGVKIHHVGVFVGDNKAIEAMGRDQGVVMRDICASGTGYWTDYGQLNYLQ